MEPQGDSHALHLFLRSNDALCPDCGYNLRDLTKEACPECGHVPRLQLARVDRPSRRMCGFVVCLGVIGAMRGGIGAYETASTLLLMIRQQVPMSVASAIVYAIWIVMFLWLALFCTVGLVRLIGKRGTRDFGLAFNRLVLRLLAFVGASFVVGLLTGLGRVLRWL